MLLFIGMKYLHYCAKRIKLVNVLGGGSGVQNNIPYRGETNMKRLLWVVSFFALVTPLAAQNEIPNAGMES